MLGLMFFNISTNNLDSGSKRALNKFVYDTNLTGAVDIRKKRDSI